jgi:hypothetical protein
VQFPISPVLFDRFFNSRVGYRAQFRGHYGCGLAFNDHVINALRVCLDSELPAIVSVWELTGDFSVCGSTEVPKRFVTDSLVDYWSKVWFCTKRISPNGAVEEIRPWLSGPRIVLNGGSNWSAPYAGADTSWLDVKGAFLGKDGPYQVKNPLSRSKELQNRGTA